MNRVRAAAAVLVVGSALIAAVLLPRGEEPHEAWTEVAWPLPIDPWGKGRAFQCKAAVCGANIVLYVRPKLGFCNCLTGIADDDDLDRMSDLELIGAEATPNGAGRAVEVGWMKGRARIYAVNGSNVVAVAFNDRCDMVVATAVLGQAAPASAEARVVDFLNSAPMLDWAKVKLGI